MFVTQGLPGSIVSRHEERLQHAVCSTMCNALYIRASRRCRAPTGPCFTCQPPLNSLHSFVQSLCLKPRPVSTLAMRLSASYLHPHATSYTRPAHPPTPEFYAAGQVCSRAQRRHTRPQHRTGPAPAAASPAPWGHLQAAQTSPQQAQPLVTEVRDGQRTLLCRLPGSLQRSLCRDDRGHLRPHLRPHRAIRPAYGCLLQVTHLHRGLLVNTWAQRV